MGPSGRSVTTVSASWWVVVAVSGPAASADARGQRDRRDDRRDEGERRGAGPWGRGHQGVSSRSPLWSWRRRTNFWTLPDGVRGRSVDHVERLGPLLAGQPGGLEVGAHGVEGRRRAALAGADDRGGPLAQAVVGGGDDAHLGHPVEAGQELLDLAGADVLAAPDDDVGEAVGDGEVALVVEHPDVAGVVPALVVERRRGERRGRCSRRSRSGPRLMISPSSSRCSSTPGMARPSVVSRFSSGSSIRQPVIDGCSVLP